jgi:hypothetical protein
MKLLFTLSIVLFFSVGTGFAQKLGDLRKNIDGKELIKKTVNEPKPEEPKTTNPEPQDTTIKKPSSPAPHSDKLSIGEEGDEEKKKGGGKKTLDFIKDSKGNNQPGSSKTTPNTGGNLIDPNGTKKNLSINEEGSEENKKKNEPPKQNQNSGTGHK